MVVLAGATAVRAVLGPGRTIGALRGQVLAGGPAPATVVTIHPSAVVRLSEPDRSAALAGLVSDLRLAASTLSAGP